MKTTFFISNLPLLPGHQLTRHTTQAICQKLLNERKEMLLKQENWLNFYRIFKLNLFKQWADELQQRLERITQRLNQLGYPQRYDAPAAQPMSYAAYAWTIDALSFISIDEHINDC